MGVFDKYLNKKRNNGDVCRPTTENFFIGSPEAESEATITPITLDQFFEDYLDILSQLNNEKFIVLGRKGSGKSAIGEHMFALAQGEPNLFCKFIKKPDIDVEHIVQIGKEQGYSIERSLLYKWIMLTHLLDLILQNQSAIEHPAFKFVKQFVDRNRGFIDIRKDEIRETIIKSGLTVGAEYLNRAVSAIGHKEREIKGGRADFYKMLPNLELILSSILKCDKNNQYIVIFDDLDIGYHTDNPNDIETTADLLRMAKYFNVDFFARNGIDSKVFVLLRSDIAKSILYTADMGKLLNSYSVELNWFEDIYRGDETKSFLRQFINKRISVNYNKLGYKINDKSDPWTSFVDEKSFYGKTGFKYVIDHTFYRPRDLILFFKDINTLNLELPLRQNDIKNALLPRYVTAMVKDLKGEFSLRFCGDDIESAFRALKRLTPREPFMFDFLLELMIDEGIDEKNGEDMMQALFEYSLIGNYQQNNVRFKYREGGAENIEMDKKDSFILHYLLQAYFRHN